MHIPTPKLLSTVATALAVFGPIGRCPACLSATTGFAAAVGLGVLASRPWFLPLITGFLLVGIAGSIRSARASRKWQGTYATILGAILLVGGRILARTTVLWIGAALLTAGWLVDLYWKRKLAAPRLVQISSIS